MASGQETAASRLRAEIRAEQAHIDRAYERVDALLARARGISSEVQAQGKGITRQMALDREAAVGVTAKRLQELRLGEHTQLCFGRIDREDGERYYIGRFGVSDDEDDPLIVDWRAPVAEPFYRATGRASMGVTLRRHFLARGRVILGLDDEILSAADRVDGDKDGETAERVLAGEAALLAALTRARTGRMGDIVATIQSEQDEVIRAPLAGIVVVQGGPGTGKTAVALHRAAYLLYTHRFPLESAGVLFVGPNPTFLRYVEGVLPSLGEESVTLATPTELVDGMVVTRRDPFDVARVKSDLRMTDVIARAVRDRQRRLRKPASIPVGPYTLEIDAEVSARIVARARKADGTHNARRAIVERLVLKHLRDAYRDALERDVRIGRRGPDSRTIDDAEIQRMIVSRRETRVAFERMWPVLTPQKLLSDLFRSTPLLASACRDVLSDDERDGLSGADGTEESWAEHDIALLDEAAELLGDPPVRPQRGRRRSGSADTDTDADVAFQSMIERTMADGDFAPRCLECESELAFVGNRSNAGHQWQCAHPSCGLTFASRQVLSPAAEVRFHELRTTLGAHAEKPPERRDGPRTYGHVLVDEAQDLTPMQWRMLARRCPSRSMTVVGDLGQASKLWAPRTWDEVTALLRRGDDQPAAKAELSVNYRTPSEVMELAAAVLAAGGQDLEPPQSVRSAGVAPRAVKTTASRRAGVIRRVVAEERSAVGDGKVAVVTPAALVTEARAWLDAGGDLDAPVVVLPLDDAKGLEFDAVVMIEPAALVHESEQGLRALYVGLTRTTTRLALVHAEPLPDALAAHLHRT